LSFFFFYRATDFPNRLVFPETFVMIAISSSTYPMKKAPPIRYGPSLSAGYLPYLSNKKILQENREMQKTSKSEIEIGQEKRTSTATSIRRKKPLLTSIVLAYPLFGYNIWRVSIFDFILSMSLLVFGILPFG
jgi:hypothetical protein